ncbi:MAG TPA: hypothetical protein PLA94_28010, partial [Myxococcota bacterium]|nr:hypothetical protein [Myxococcota bacterium]
IPEIERLATLSDGARLRERNRALVAGDTLQQQYNAEFSRLLAVHGIEEGPGAMAALVARRLPPAEVERLVDLAERVSNMQSRANFFTVEAYIGAGAGRMVVTGLRVQGIEAYQAARSQLGMIEHIIAGRHGNVGDAGRQYEIYKYIQRFIQASRSAGVDHPAFAGFAAFAVLMTKLDRGFLTSPRGVYTPPRAMNPVGDLPPGLRSRTQVNDAGVTVPDHGPAIRYYAEEDYHFDRLSRQDQDRVVQAVHDRLDRPARDKFTPFPNEPELNGVAQRIHGRLTATLPTEVRITDPARPGTRTQPMSDELIQATLRRFEQIAWELLPRLRGEAPPPARLQGPELRPPVDPPAPPQRSSLRQRLDQAMDQARSAWQNWRSQRTAQQTVRQTEGVIQRANEVLRKVNEAESMQQARQTFAASQQSGATGTAHAPVRLLGDDVKTAAVVAAVTPMPGVRDVVIHGSPNGFAILQGGKWVDVNHRTLARLLQQEG